MADNKNGKKEEVAAAPAKKKGKGLLIAIIAVIVLGAGAAGFFVFQGKSQKAAAEPGKDAQKTEAGATQGEGAKGEGSASSGSIFKLEPFIVNLQDNSGTRYLKLTVNLEVSSNTPASELESKSGQIRDSLIILLSSKSYADVGTVEGKYQLRDEILQRVNQYLAHGKVKTAYFTEFVIQ